MSTTIDKTVVASADDASEVATAVSLTANPLANCDTTGVWNGWRWTGITIPALAHIVTAYMTLQFTSSTLDEPDVTIYGEQSSNPGTFTTGASNISGRSRTAASVNWSNTNAGTSDVNTASLVAIIQELIDDYGGLNNAPIALLWTTRAASSTRDTSVRSYDNSTTLCGRLHIVYDAPSEAILSQTQANDGISATATVEAKATVGLTQQADTIVSTFTAASEASAVLEKTQDNDTIVSASAVEAQATLSLTQQSDVITSTSTIEVKATLSLTQQADGINSTATVEAKATLSNQQENNSLSSQVTAEASLLLTSTQNDNTLVGTATNLASLTSTLNQEANGISSQAKVDLILTLTKIQENNVLSAQATVTSAGDAEFQANITQQSNIPSIQVQVPIFSNVSIIQNNDTIVGTIISVILIPQVNQVIKVLSNLIKINNKRTIMVNRKGIKWHN